MHSQRKCDVQHLWLADSQKFKACGAGSKELYERSKLVFETNAAVHVYPEAGMKYFKKKCLFFVEG